MAEASQNQIGGNVEMNNVNNVGNYEAAFANRKSEVWDHLSPIEKDKDGKAKLKCNHCDKIYPYQGTKNGTSTFTRHLGVCKGKTKTKFGDVSSMLFNRECQLKGKKIDQKTCRDWMTKVSIAHGLPLKWIEYILMRGFLKYLNPEIKFTTRNTMAIDVLKMYELEKQKLKSTLKNIPGMVCLTYDIWTSCTTAGYICVSANYVDDKWLLNNKILAFCSMPPPHSGPKLAQKIYDCLVEWEIDGKIFTLTLDNASSNNHMVRILKQRLLLQNALLCNGDYFHVRCCAHILNLIVQEGLKVATDALEKIRGSIKYVKASEARMNKFRECAQKVGIEITTAISLDVVTRWNSTYFMLASAIKYRRVFSMLAFDDLAFKVCPSPEEWTRGEKMCDFLRPFYTITNMISGSSYPTSNLYFMEVWKIACLLKKYSESEDEIVRDMTTLMKSKFKKYWDEYSEILAMGAVFDPRLKLTFLEYCYAKVDPLTSRDKVDSLKIKLYLFYDEYKKRGAESSSRSPNSSSQAGESNISGGAERQSKGKGLDLDPFILNDYRNYRNRWVLVKRSQPR